MVHKLLHELIHYIIHEAACDIHLYPLVLTHGSILGMQYSVELANFEGEILYLRHNLLHVSTFVEGI